MKLKKVKIVNIDLKGVSSLNDVISKFLIEFNVYSGIYGKNINEYENNLKSGKIRHSWNGFFDLMSSLDELREEGYDTLLLTVRNVDDVYENVSESEYYELLYSLMRISDPGQRYDGLDVFVRKTGDEEKFPPYALSSYKD